MLLTARQKKGVCSRENSYYFGEKINSNKDTTGQHMLSTLLTTLLDT